MKVSMLGLALSTVAFGASSIYLWNQLSNEREQIAAVREANAQLNARIAELEKRRAVFAGQRMGGPGTFEGAVAMQAGPGPEEEGELPPEDADDMAHVKPSSMRVPPRMPEGMMKMMRANMRAQNKRMYFDMQSKLGLTDEQTSALLDLMTDQQTQGFRNARNLDPEQARTWWEDEEAKQKAAIADLLGPAKAEQFEQYQNTMPSRSELSLLSQQLEGAETPLSDSQRSRMLDALIEERARIPMPSYAEGTLHQDVVKAYNEWQTDYEKRVAEQARTILTSEQLSTYNEYAQWQREMREQFSAGMPPMRGPSGSGPPAISMGFVNAVTVTTDSTSSPTDKQPKPK
jgi:hypothetical protein